MTGRRVLPDLNAMAIRLVDDHPGHPYISEELVPALTGTDTLVVFGYLPLQIQWILEDIGFDTVDARNAVSSFLEYPMEFADVDDETLRAAYDISAEKNHDVYDCFYVALARETDVDVICTTDTDFERLCVDEPFEYRNPVPNDVLEEFRAVDE